MNPLEFAIDATAYGVPSREELVSLRIWDLHYHGFFGEFGLPHEEVMFYVDRMGIEHLFTLDIGRRAGRAKMTPEQKLRLENEEITLLGKWRDRISGLIRVDPAYPADALERMERLIRRGPCVGIKYSLNEYDVLVQGATGKGVTCAHPDNDSIIRLAAELGAIIYIHSLLKVGGNPRQPGGGNEPGEATPMDVVSLARRFPNVPLICGHSGGDWEIAARAVRPCQNVFFEFSGTDPHSGQVDQAVHELGEDRILWGGHGPSRSYATELSKVFDADLNRGQQEKILGRNLRRLAAPVFQRKGRSIVI